MLRQQQLDGECAIQICIANPVDHAHSTDPDNLLNAIAPYVCREIRIAPSDIRSAGGVSPVGRGLLPVVVGYLTGKRPRAALPRIVRL
jgi:hypothetical protein